ncbi:MAG TPA: metallophosphoesterase, partial [Bacteroidales bacterium]|nr:metallophosphoesterase [Bacteroidales bacterium]
MTLLRFLIFIFGFILLNIYLFIRGWQALSDKYVMHLIYTIVFLVASTSVFIAIFAGNRLPLWLSQTLEIIGGYWVILFIFILLAAFLGDILRIADHYFGIFPQWIIVNYQQVKQGYFLLLLLFLMLISVVGYIRFDKPAITKINIPLEKKNREKGEVHVIAVSDIHLGNLIRKGRLGKWVNIINTQKPDIILIAGDLFDHNMRTVELQQMDQELSRLDAPYGVYAIPGNHDYYAGIEQAISFMKKSGIKVLRDQSVMIDQKFIIIGRDDITNRKRKTLETLVNGLKPGLPLI